MKKLLSAFVLLLISCSLYCQIKDFAQKASKEHFSFDYTYTAETDVLLKGSGKLSVQGDCYILTADGLQHYCDGKNRWIVDEQAEEVVIEAIDPGIKDFAANPALMLSSFETAFEIISSKNTLYHGRAASLVQLRPSKSTALTSAELIFAEAKPVALLIELESGTEIELEITNFKWLPAEEISVFEYQIPQNFLTTDLR